MTTPENPENPENLENSEKLEIPGLKDALARARAAHEGTASEFDEDQEPEPDEIEPDEPVGWQPVWKRLRKPKSKAAKKAELRKQRKRLRNAGQPRFAAGQSRRPRSRQNRIGNTAACRDVRARPGCGIPTPGCGDDARHRPPSGAHDVPHPDAGWNPLGGADRVDSTVVRTG